MTKIIRQGQIPEEKMYRITCSNCHTLFEFQRLEAKYNNDQRDGDFLSINCPLCQKNCTVAVKSSFNTQDFYER